MKGTRNEELRYAYANAVTRLIDGLTDKDVTADNEWSLDIQKKLALYHVKYIPIMKENSKLTYEELINKFHVFDVIHLYLSKFTPREFMQYFPIQKDYDGKKYGTKDYFTTMEYVNKLNRDEPIGKDRIDNFLWEYWNWDLIDFEEERFMTASDLRVAQGGKGIIEEWCEKKGVTTYSVYTDDQGQQFLQDNKSGKTAKVKEYKRRPKWIHAVK